MNELLLFISFWVEDEGDESARGACFYDWFLRLFSWRFRKRVGGIRNGCALQSFGDDPPVLFGEILRVWVAIWALLVLGA